MSGWIYVFRKGGNKMCVEKWGPEPRAGAPVRCPKLEIEMSPGGTIFGPAGPASAPDAMGFVGIFAAV